MRFAQPSVLAAIPFVLLAIGWSFRRARGAAGASFVHLTRLWADRHGLSDRPAATRRRARGLALAGGSVLALLALARPQWGEIAEQTYDQSREVMLALDLSRSMLADDVSPSRLARAKLLVESLLDELCGERVGLIVFAGSAFTQSPLSADYEVLRDFLGELDPSYLPQGGTDYEAMLKTALQAFGQQRGGDRYLVVLSDGEAQDEGWKALGPQLHAQGIRVIGLGIGTPQGALVPAAGGGITKDASGNAVLSKLEPATLQALAEQTGGAYRDAATWVDLPALIDATVEQGRQGRYVEERNVRLQDRFQWFLAPALLCLLFSLWIEYPISPLARALPLRGRRTTPAGASLMAAVFLVLVAWPSLDQARAAVSDALPPPPSATAPSQPNTLQSTIEELIAKPALGAPDYARLATDTIAFAAQPQAPQGAPRTGIIDDALAAVDRGETIDGRAADWPRLRAALERLKQQQAEPPPSQSPQQQEERQQEQGQGGQQDQPQQGRGGQQAQPQQGHGGQQHDDRQANGQSSGQGSQQPGEQQAGHDQRDQDADGAGGHDQAARSPDGGQDGKDQQQPKGNEVARQDDVKPVDAPGLADQKQQQDAKQERSAAPAESASPAASQRQPKRRMVGGGRALPGVEPQGDMAIAEALGTMERVRQGDSPAVLFDRLNRAEGQPPRTPNTRDW